MFTKGSPRTRGDGPDLLEAPVLIRLRSPRTRGDGPSDVYWKPQWETSSPRTRGDGPEISEQVQMLSNVLPARAGMARSTAKKCPSKASFSPHARGWPAWRGCRRRSGQRSPRTRGDGPPSARSMVIAACVLPARAGMARDQAGDTEQPGTFSPHARGWPAQERPGLLHQARSPRTRGDGPADVDKIWAVLSVLPARAGMARGNYKPAIPPCRSPRTRGDGPWDDDTGNGGWFVLPARAGMARTNAASLVLPGSFSPHARGWPVRHAVVLLHLLRSPCTRGDGPVVLDPGVGEGLRSPRTRGDGPLRARHTARRPAGSPRTRGDGPTTRPPPPAPSSFSPHARGWPGVRGAEGGGGRAFSPHARGWPGEAPRPQ